MEEGSGGAEEPGHASEYITKCGASGALLSSWLVGAPIVTSEKRARTAAMIENRMKTMTERLEVKDAETVDSPSSNPPSFYTATQKRP